MTQNSNIIAVDCMSGDNAPEANIIGVAMSAKKNPTTKFLLFGKEDVLKQQLANLPEKQQLQSSQYEIMHCEDVVGMEDKPSVALRKKRESSMYLAIKSVKEKVADACVSSGNTGALMAMSLIQLRTVEGISRPAITSYMPTTILGKSTVMLDLGANVDNDAKDLLEFALLGTAFYEAFYDSKNPKFALLNIGTEQAKGNKVVKEADKIMSHLNIVSQNKQYVGYVEPNRILSGDVDVIIAGGFIGNIALKSIEGAVSSVAKICKNQIKKRFLLKVGMLLSYFGIKDVVSLLHPDKYNGAVLMGLKGTVIKSHGSASAGAFENALNVAQRLTTVNLNKRLIELVESEKHALDLNLSQLLATADDKDKT